ncbi:MAG TPA: hypothetical protein VJ461_02445 [Candidatus Nanoarchaeia archaeon]|nr:hypothetical protein [Candidatus Nanoarchaeia archaeon]
MAQKYEWEFHAKKVISDLNEFVDLENQFIKKEHELKTIIISMDSIILHLDDIIPNNAQLAQELNNNISGKLKKIVLSIEQEEQKEVYFENEEAELITKLEKDLAHRDWKAIRRDVALEEQDEKSILRLEEEELRELNRHFKELAELIQKSLPSLTQDAELKKSMEYFNHLYRVATAYEKIFKDLWVKESVLFKQTSTTSKMMK